MIPENAQPIVDALATSDPVALLNWINKATAAQILVQLVTENQVITHEALDKFRPDQTVKILRAGLVCAGVLLSRDEHLAVLEQWLTDFTDGISDPARQRIVRRWATWTHLRRLRSQSQREPIAYNQIGSARYQIKLVGRFLEWLHARGIALNTCSQADVDEFLAAGKPRYRDIRVFITWAMKNKECSKLDVPYIAAERSYAPIADDQRWALVKRLLHDRDLDPGDRLAGLLMLLFAQRAARIVKLTISDIRRTGSRTTIFLGATPLDLPAPVDEIARLLVDQRRHYILVIRPEEIPWLFPGGLPGTHISAARLGTRLKNIGISPRPSRNAALVHLASEIPAVVLSNLLGIHIGTAVGWAEIGALSRGSYASARMSKPARSTGAPVMSQ